MLSPDYQQFELNETGIASIGPRMTIKLKALEAVWDVQWRGKSVLDVGCDFGFWCFWAAEHGAAAVLGIDRGRKVSGTGFVDLPKHNTLRAARVPAFVDVTFLPLELGVQWHDLAEWDITLCLSMYHHVFQAAGGDHHPIWYWLWQRTGERLIWEAPTDVADRTVQLNVDKNFWHLYTRKRIWAEANYFFDVVAVGPAEHEPHREIWVLEPRDLPGQQLTGKAVSGAGGASRAFAYADGRRMDEMEHILGVRPVPGSLNVRTHWDFDWSWGYYRAQVLDVVDRKAGLEGPWLKRWARFYPLRIMQVPGYAFRFEGDTYDENFVEVVSHKRLRGSVRGLNEKTILMRGISDV